MTLLDGDFPSFQDLRRQQLFSQLGQAGSRLLAAGQAGLAPGQRAALVGDAFGAFQAGPPIQQMLGLAQLQNYQQQAQQQQEQAAREQRQRVAAQGLFGTAPQRALAAGGGPTPQAAGLLGQPSALMGNVPPQAQPFLSALAETDPQQAIQEALALSTRTPRAPATTAAGTMQWNAASGRWEPIPGAIEAQTQLRAAGRPQTQVNVGPTGIDYGEPERGLVWARNPDGTVRLDERGAPVAIPYRGGSVFEEQQAAEATAAGRQAQRATTAGIVVDNIDRFAELAQTSPVPVTGFGALLAGIPGLPQTDARGMLNTVKANIGFDKLQQMRENSPTGGALGNVSNFEVDTLQATMGSLEQAQTQGQILYNLEKIRELYLDVIDGPNRPNRRYPNAPPIGATIRGDDREYRYTGGDPNDSRSWEPVR